MARPTDPEKRLIKDGNGFGLKINIPWKFLFSPSPNITPNGASHFDEIIFYNGRINQFSFIQEKIEESERWNGLSSVQMYHNCLAFINESESHATLLRKKTLREFYIPRISATCLFTMWLLKILRMIH